MTRIYQPKHSVDGTLNPKYAKHSGQKKGVFDHATFISWDGEGATINGTHRYILLRCSTGEYIQDTDNGLSTKRCFRFIAEIARHLDRRSIHVCYGSSYDVNMILRDLTHEQLEELWTKGRTIYDEYMIEYRQRKQFTIRVLPKHGQWMFDPKKQRWNRRYKQTITLWDVLGYFQSSFVQAMGEYLPDYDAERLNNIKAHKLQRSEFRPEEFNEINDYCGMEIEALDQIMKHVHTAMTTAHIKVARWDGAGSIAAALLRKHNVHNHMQDFGGDVRREAWRAYAGGRIETVKYGHTQETIYHYDINSAYPAALRKVPSLYRGTWRYVRDYIPHTFSLWRIEYSFREAQSRYPYGCYPFFYRTPSGHISFPVEGKGTYWEPEIHAALSWQPNAVRIIDGWIWEPETGDKPFAFIDDLYKQRRVWKQEGNAAQKIIKLGMNSLYGKLAQQVSWKRGDKPAWQQIEWAGYITSFTRASLFTCVMEYLSSVVMFTTDGIFTTEPLPIVAETLLGGYSVATHDELITVQSGVYWTRNGDLWNDYYRGFDRGQINQQNVLASWSNMQTTLPVNSTRFVTLGLALTGEQSWRDWHEWRTKERKLKLTPHGTKRQNVDKWTKQHNPAHELMLTYARHNPYAKIGEESAIYEQDEEVIEERKWREAEWDAQL